MKIIVTHGAGVDSLAALYYVLKNTDIDVFVIHVFTFGIKSSKIELEYFKKQIDYLLNNTRRFKYRIFYVPKSEVLKGKQDVKLMKKILDVMKENPEYEYFMSGRCIEDAETPGDNWAVGAGVLFKEKTGKEYLDYRHRSYFFDKPKLEEFDYLPYELQQMTWACIDPIDDKHCGKCSKCNELKTAKIFDRLTHVIR